MSSPEATHREWLSSLVSDFGYGPPAHVTVMTDDGLLCEDVVIGVTTDSDDQTWIQLDGCAFSFPADDGCSGPVWIVDPMTVTRDDRLTRILTKICREAAQDRPRMSVVKRLCQEFVDESDRSD